MAVIRNRGVVAFPRAPPLLHTFVAGPLLQTLVAASLQNIVIFNKFVAGKVCRKNPR